MGRSANHRTGKNRAIHKAGNRVLSSVNQFINSPSIGEDYFYAYTFPHKGRIKNAFIHIGRLSSTTITLVADIETSDGFNMTQAFILREGRNTIPEFDVDKHSIINLRFDTGEEVGVEVGNVQVNFEVRSK